MYNKPSFKISRPIAAPVMLLLFVSMSACATSESYAESIRKWSNNNMERLKTTSSSQFECPKEEVEVTCLATHTYADSDEPFCTTADVSACSSNAVFRLTPIAQGNDDWLLASDS